MTEILFAIFGLLCVLAAISFWAMVQWKLIKRWRAQRQILTDISRELDKIIQEAKKL